MIRYTQASFAAPDRDPGLDETLCIHQRTDPTENRSLVLFIHGLGGKRYGQKSTWGLFPEYIYQDISSVDIGLYGYRTLLRRLCFSRSIDLQDEARVLANTLRDLDGYDRVVLVGHSMGGLLSKAAVAELVITKQFSTLSRLRGLILMATPQLGSLRVSPVLQLLSRDAQVLTPHNKFLSHIDRVFSNEINPRADADVLGRLRLPVWAVLAASDFWVDQLSAGLHLPENQQKFVAGTHTSIVKPPSKASDAYTWVRGRLVGCLGETNQSAVPLRSVPLSEPSKSQQMSDDEKGQKGQLSVYAFTGVASLDERIKKVGPGDWEYAAGVAIDILGYTDRFGENRVFSALLSYLDRYSESDVFWSVTTVLESCAQLLPNLMTHDAFYRMANHPHSTVRSAAASLCMEFAESAPFLVPVDILLKLSAHDEDWYVQAPANAAIKTLARNQPVVLRIFMQRLRSTNPDERSHAAHALADIANREPEILDGARLSRAAAYLESMDDEDALNTLLEVLAKVPEGSPAFRYKYGL